MNVRDSEVMSAILQESGYQEVPGAEDAEVLIFNTCCIREKAEQKFFSELGKYKKLKSIRPSLHIAVTGCIAQQQGDRVFRRAPYVSSIIGPQNIMSIRNIIENKEPSTALCDNHRIAGAVFPVLKTPRVSALVTIMIGCNNYCSYCVVPYTRGREKSRATSAILQEIRTLAGQGCKEVTLLGQNVNSYQDETDFSGLLRKIGKIEGISRIRFVTSHPKDLSRDLIDTISKEEKVCEHIHLPLQSGSTSILNLMNRGYTFDEYREMIKALRSAMPDIAITSDIIAGFPQETAEDHMNTIKALQEIEFDGIFAFAFSPRPGTRAASLAGHLDGSLKSSRLCEILALQNEITDRKNKQLEGSLQDVLIECSVGGKETAITGRTRTNKIVKIRHSTKPIQTGDFISVQILRSHRHTLEGIPAH